MRGLVCMSLYGPFTPKVGLQQVGGLICGEGLYSDHYGYCIICVTTLSLNADKSGRLFNVVFSIQNLRTLKILTESCQIQEKNTIFRKLHNQPKSKRKAQTKHAKLFVSDVDCLIR